MFVRMGRQRVFAREPPPTLQILCVEDGPPRVFCDGLTGGLLLGKPEDVERYRACFDMLSDLALDQQSSKEYFAEVKGRQFGAA